MKSAPCVTPSLYTSAALPSHPRPIFRHSCAPSVIPAQAGTTALASAHQAVAASPIAHSTAAAGSLPPTPRFRHSCAPSVIPAQAGTHTHRITHTTPFPNSSLPPSRGEVRWGVKARERTSSRCAGLRSPTQPPPRARCLQPPASVIPTQAGTHHPPPTPPPFPNSSLPPSRGEVRWGVEARERARGRCAKPRSPTQPPPQARCLQPPASVIPAFPPSFLRRQEPTHSHTTSPSPIHPSPLPGGRLGGGWKLASAHQAVALDSDRPLNRRRRLAASNPPLSLPPSRGER